MDSAKRWNFLTNDTCITSFRVSCHLNLMWHVLTSPMWVTWKRCGGSRLACFVLHWGQLFTLGHTLDIPNSWNVGWPPWGLPTLHCTSSCYCLGQGMWKRTLDLSLVRSYYASIQWKMNHKWQMFMYYRKLRRFVLQVLKGNQFTESFTAHMTPCIDSCSPKVNCDCSNTLNHRELPTGPGFYVCRIWCWYVQALQFLL